MTGLRVPVEVYWADLSHERRRLGVGFLLAQRYLLTADHCLRKVPDDAELVIDFGPDGELRGRIHERLVDADLALIWLLSKPRTIRPMLADRVRTDDRWRVPSRPTESDPHLNGVVNGNSSFRTANGAVINALELRTEIELGDYSGYSGGPVERMDGDERTLAGILLEQYPERLEQYPDRRERRRATNVLFAVTIKEVIDRFDSFDLDSLKEIIGLRASKSNTTRPDAGATTQILGDADAAMHLLSGWDLPAEEALVLKLRIARNVVDRLTGHEPA